VGSLIFIFAPVIGVMFLATVFVIALGIVAARADEHFDQQLAEERARVMSALSGFGSGGRYAPPPPEVTTAMAVAATTSTAEMAMTRRWPTTLPGNAGRRMPIPIDTPKAQQIKRPPAI
jgi:hypothetical protein